MCFLVVQLSFSVSILRVSDGAAGISSEHLSPLRCFPTNVWMNIWLPCGLGPLPVRLLWISKSLHGHIASCWVNTSDCGRCWNTLVEGTFQSGEASTIPAQLHIRAQAAWPLHQHSLCFRFSSGCVMFCHHRFNLYSLTIGEAKHLSMCCSPFLHLHPWSDCSKLLPIFRLGWLPFTVLRVLCINIFRMQVLYQWVTYEYRFPVCGFLFLAMLLWLALWDLSFPTRDEIQALGSETEES